MSSRSKNLRAFASSRETKKEEDKPALVPKLRFPEFREAGEWTEIPLREFLIESRLPGSKGNVAKKITVKLWGNGVFEKNDAIQGSINTQYFRRKAGQFIYSKLDFLNQAFGIIPPHLDNFESTVDLPCFDFAEGLNPVFLLEYVKRKDFYERLGETADGSRKARRIHAKTFLSFPITLPSSAEQQKIAECLSSVDELLAAQARKVDALKTHKKGLMQQLFPREGETQPRLRFPEFRNSGEWEETELGKLISIKGRIGYRGYTVADIVNAGEGAISLSPSNITESGVLGFEKATYITWAKYHESPEIMVEREQTLLVKTGSTFGKVAYVWDLPQECTVNPQIVVLKPHSIHPYFLFLLVFGDVIQTKILAIVVGGAIPTLSQEAVSKFKIRVPKNAEQQRIADCLSSLDALITAETQKLETLKTHKKALMQQLFPSAEEVDA